MNSFKTVIQLLFSFSILVILKLELSLLNVTKYENPLHDHRFTKVTVDSFPRL